MKTFFKISLQTVAVCCSLSLTSCCLFNKKDNPVVPTNVAAYGDIITLKHKATQKRLHSHPFNYGHPQSSQQQQITAFESLDDNDYWKIKGANANSANLTGTHIKNNDIIRLEHVATGKNLHSHRGVPSPVTKQQEVTGFGVNGQGDGNDDWKIEIADGGEWENGKDIRLVHVGTGANLHSHLGAAHAQWTKGQQEVTAFSGRDDNDFWYFAERKK